MTMVFLRRKYRILLLISIAGFLFLCFQLFSFKVISISGRMAHENQHQARVLDNDIKVEFEQKKSGIDSKRAHGNTDNLMAGKVKNEDQKERKDSVPLDGKETADEPQLVRGIHIHQVEDYKNKNGIFQCIKSKEQIPFSQVNDDFCDCDDGTDEPGTSACPDSVFHCTFQNSDQPPQKILGSRVNDGVCDCCDGSDEWAGIQVYGGVHLTDKRYEGSLTHSPCKNTCAAERQSHAEDARIREMGRRLKHTYIESGKKVKDTDAYGPEGVFYQLSLTCFDYETSEYKYKFCPFKSVTQQNFPSAAISIGKKPVWRTRLKGVYVLKMEGGDLSACPGGKQRQTVITFVCGLSDHIIEISEDEKCVYGLKFSTPAAC